MIFQDVVLPNTSYGKKMSTSVIDFSVECVLIQFQLTNLLNASIKI